ncbi:uncharacterized protein PHACADRAFT_33578 [Phanerochaete carnosa HHB-10118-sp]|uniref:Uncharacterized protein n=1 Tax=Phanerochaete carnosa (strain HHB-10118-sp) TaxID=650164 RepID=K5VR34_PHACS|nr:uncharacterized protein PHACADRAFT_33578 [Phanerochaete carnosa HHB-10118-sp]EKM49200.1 hypothetical protein PHACADRAFT_33578 [Phanerochaete carnosa HHB-10118-sp]
MFHSEAALAYAAQLRNHGHGEPLWQPEPSKYGEVLIGDVGFIEDGCFYRLFNCTLAADDPINSGFVPHGYVPLEYNEWALLQTRENYLPPKPIYSKSISQFKSEAGAAADFAVVQVRMQKPGGSDPRSRFGRHLISRASESTIHEYVRMNHASWHAFAVDQGRMIAPEDVVLWAVAAVANHGKSHAISFGAEGGIASAEFAVEHSAEAVMSVSQRSGPKRDSARTSEDSLGNMRDQCLFVRYYKVKYRRFLPMKIVAEAEPKEGDASEGSGDGCSPGGQLTPVIRGHDGAHLRVLVMGSPTLAMSRSTSEDYVIDVEEMPSGRKLRDALDDLLDYILECSDASSAIVTHDDLSLLGINSDEDSPGSIMTALMSLHPQTVVDAHGGKSKDSDSFVVGCIVTETAEPSFNVLSDLPNRDIVGGLDPLASFDENSPNISITEEYNPAEYNIPNSSGVITFDEHFMSVVDSVNLQASVSNTPPSYNNAPLPSAYDHAPTASSNGASNDHSRAFSSSSYMHPNSPPLNSLTQNFESMHFESPSWPTSWLPPDGRSPPVQQQQKTELPAQLVILDISSPATAVHDESSTTNAPEDDGMSTGPQLHVVPAMSVSGGGATPLLQQGVLFTYGPLLCGNGRGLSANVTPNLGLCHVYTSWVSRSLPVAAHCIVCTR